MTKVEILKKQVPEYVTRISFIDDFYQASGHALEQYGSDKDDFYAQLNVETATWGLRYWEEFVGIVTDASKTLEGRRANVLAALQSSKTLTRQALVDLFALQGLQVVKFDENKAPYTIEIYTDKPLGNLQTRDFIDSLKRVFPAHLQLVTSYGSLESEASVDIPNDNSGPILSPDQSGLFMTPAVHEALLKQDGTFDVTLYDPTTLATIWTKNYAPIGGSSYYMYCATASDEYLFIYAVKTDKSDGTGNDVESYIWRINKFDTTFESFDLTPYLTGLKDVNGGRRVKLHFCTKDGYLYAVATYANRIFRINKDTFHVDALFDIPVPVLNAGETLEWGPGNGYAVRPRSYGDESYFFSCARIRDASDNPVRVQLMLISLSDFSARPVTTDPRAAQGLVPDVVEWMINAETPTNEERVWDSTYGIPIIVSGQRSPNITFQFWYAKLDNKTLQVTTWFKSPMDTGKYTPTILTKSLYMISIFMKAPGITWMPYFSMPFASMASNTAYPAGYLGKNVPNYDGDDNANNTFTQLNLTRIAYKGSTTPLYKDVYISRGMYTQGAEDQVYYVYDNTNLLGYTGSPAYQRKLYKTRSNAYSKFVLWKK